MLPLLHPARRPSTGARALMLSLAVLLGAAAPGTASAPSDGFETWLADFEAEALERGISSQTVEAALGGVELIPRVIELDRRQPRSPRDFCGYLDRRLTETRIERGRRVLKEHRALLEEITAEYGVPSRYLVALWGLETNFGDYLGDFPVIASLVTLAYDSRRSDVFREQVLAALRIVDEGHHDPRSMKGSWAGATGQVQLMPTTFLEYAVDYDGDGRKDVWTSLPDALATAANYLRESGWRSGETWGRQVQLPDALRRDAASLRRSRPLAHWQQSGVRRIDGGELPVAEIRGSIVLPVREPDPAFLVYRNYRTFLAWNNSTFFAISVGALADEIAGVGPLRVCGS
jgi:membrane-bound lytic murein transglycosylase B